MRENGVWRLVAVALVIIVVTVFGFSLIDVNGGDVTAAAVLSPSSGGTEGFARAIGAWDWQFPRDHGAHPDFQTEWWYYTGNLAAEDGQRFGFQFTIFRRAISTESFASDSEWRTGQIYMAHFTLSDLESGRFFHDERYSRGGAGLAGALPDDSAPQADYRVWLEDWEVTALDDSAQQFRITASSQTPAGRFAVNFTLDQIKAPALQGDSGLSAKSEEAGNASYYYSLSRLLTDGSITLDDDVFTVSGTTWMDHEFSTSALGNDALGWDWFGLHFDDGRDLMIGQIRLVDGGRDPFFGGLLIAANGDTRYLDAADFTIQSGGTWQSPHTGAIYPAGWTLTLRGAALDEAEDLIIAVTPMMADQELNSGGIAYWEGAVRLDGGVTGYGYAELTGYASAMTGRF